MNPRIVKTGALQLSLFALSESSAWTNCKPDTTHSQSQHLANFCDTRLSFVRFPTQAIARLQRVSKRHYYQQKQRLRTHWAGTNKYGTEAALDKERGLKSGHT
ncbi:hypothetical protein [Rhodoferax antarcticus]|uniref:Uncharacterized protein n=1 Tax=Rhodoferax antarcticus ANT.BR TaxID=1111071 RepID=A0A1Q8YFZ9_9BURK|nr:hypothetical protein [Rhodoferax antarcticus]MCW2312666.1 hypothetical protein [Rhodoferax antarcticus]OLP06912.1 hypothetical protein BLL52_1658 [Rhodoferax antarcticus ANT.BR]